MEEQDMPQGPMVQILPVENGFLITAYTGKQGANQESFDLFNTVLSSVGKSDDPMSAIKRAMDQAKLKSSTRRKPVEHHVAKNCEEALKLVSEILGTMKG